MEFRGYLMGIKWAYLWDTVGYSAGFVALKQRWMGII